MFLSLVRTIQSVPRNAVSQSMSFTPLSNTSASVLIWASAAMSARGTFSVPRHSSANRMSGCSGGFEVEFDADRFFDFLNRSPEVRREILEGFSCLEALGDLCGGNAGAHDHGTAECDLRIDRDDPRLVGNPVRS